MIKLLIATRNKGKLSEIRHLLPENKFILLTLDDTGIKNNVRETGRSFEENAVLKAREYGKLSKLLTLAEDSGLEVDALGGKPGVFSARYVKGTDTDRLNKVLEELKDVPVEKRTARFITVAALYNPKSGRIDTFRGISEGFITDAPLGVNGFGYDPIFNNSDLGKTNAQATAEEKNSVSHRARALAELKSFLIGSG